MTRRSTTFLLWLGLAVCAPLPFWMVQQGREPVAALVVKLVLLLRLIADESGLGAASAVAWMIAAQAVIGMAVLGLVAWVSVHTLERLLGPRSPAAVVTLLVALVAFSATYPMYRTPFRTGGVDSTLAEVFE